MAPSRDIVTRSQTAVTTIDADQTLKASKALLSHIKKAAEEKARNSEKKSLLLPEEEAAETPIWLTITTKRHIADTNRLKPGLIPLPHSLNTDEETTICVITADPQRTYKDLVFESGDKFPADLRKRITRVIDYTHLKKKFSSYEAQRKLYSEHDIFLGDDRIINRLPQALGKTFYKTTTKRPIPISLESKEKSRDKKPRQPKNKDAPRAATAEAIATAINKAIGSALVSLTPSNQSAVRVGRASFTPQEIAANVEAVAAGLVGKWVPQGWKNVKSIFLTGHGTAALPIWQTSELWLEETDVVADPTEEEKEQKKLLKEKANVGKKRKLLGTTSVGEEQEKTSKPAKKSKKDKNATLGDGAVEESNDGQLDKQIAERKEKLKKQKAKAKKALDD